MSYVNTRPIYLVEHFSTEKNATADILVFPDFETAQDIFLDFYGQFLGIEVPHTCPDYPTEDMSEVKKAKALYEIESYENAMDALEMAQRNCGFVQDGHRFIFRRLLIDF
ncbi:MAG: hypothetical protein ACI4OH_05255 [Mitsuokella sp.]|uniref:hypothetical protein n=1 Tax=Mitsuokella sp. TaxID=2049034 RepID=UPI003F0A8A80